MVMILALVLALLLVVKVDSKTLAWLVIELQSSFQEYMVVLNVSLCLICPMTILISSETPLIFESLVSYF